MDSTSDGQSYVYDAVGNQTLSAGRTLEYTAFNKVSRAINGSDVVEYLYGPNNEKILKSEQSSGKTDLIWYIGGVEIIIEGWSNGVPERVKSKRYIGNTLVTHHNADNIDINYLHSDHLDSIQAITKQNHETYAVHHLSYDAFGKRRNASSSQYKYDFFNPVNNLTDKGFTGQDHIDQLGLINFKARLYDPSLGMMLQADTVIPDGPVVDSINRYAYVYNNPLSYTDPSGHMPWDKNSWHVSSTYADWYQTQVKRLALKTFSTVSQVNRFLNGIQASLPAGVKSGAFGNGDMAHKSNFNTKTSESKNIKEVKKNQKDFSNDEKALRNMDFKPHLGPDKNKETKIFVDGKSESVIGTSQKGCTGTDTCDLYRNEFPDATMLVHNHLKAPVTKSGKSKSYHIIATQLARDVPGHGDHNPLKLNKTSGVITANGYRYHITGKPNSPNIKYVGGGPDNDFGVYVEQNWQPGDQNLMLKIAKDYLKDN